MKYLGLWSLGLRKFFWKISKTLQPPFYILNVRSLRLQLSSFFYFFSLWRKLNLVKTVKWNLDQLWVLVDKRFTCCHCQTSKWHLSCHQAKLKKWYRNQQTRLLMINVIVRMCYKNSNAKSSACNWLKVKMTISWNYIKYYKI